MIINDSDYGTLESDKVIRFDRKTWEYFLASISLTYGQWSDKSPNLLVLFDGYLIHFLFFQDECVCYTGSIKMDEFVTTIHSMRRKIQWVETCIDQRHVSTDKLSKLRDRMGYTPKTSEFVIYLSDLVSPHKCFSDEGIVPVRTRNGF